MTTTLRTFVAALTLGFLAFAAPSYADGTQSLCMTSMPGCVISNWGQVEPDSVDNAAIAGRPRVAGSGTGRIAVQVQPTAADARGARAAGADAVKAVVSPVDVFPRETQALVAAVQRARFNADGTIARGGDAIAAAVAQLARKADAKYVLTLYVKTPKGIRPDQSAALFRKVDAVNAAIAGGEAGKRD